MGCRHEIVYSDDTCCHCAEAGALRERAQVVAYFKHLAAPRSGMGAGLVTRQQRDAWLDAAHVIESGDHIAKADGVKR